MSLYRADCPTFVHHYLTLTTPTTWCNLLSATSHQGTLTNLSGFFRSTSRRATLFSMCATMFFCQPLDFMTSIAWRRHLLSIYNTWHCQLLVISLNQMTSACHKNLSPSSTRQPNGFPLTNFAEFSCTICAPHLRHPYILHVGKKVCVICSTSVCHFSNLNALSSFLLFLYPFILLAFKFLNFKLSSFYLKFIIIGKELQ